LKFLDHLFLSLGTLFSHVSNLAEFLLLSLVFGVEFGVVLSELAEGLARCSLDLETFHSLQHVCSVHPFDNCVHIADQFFFENLCALREDLREAKEWVSEGEWNLRVFQRVGLGEDGGWR